MMHGQKNIKLKKMILYWCFKKIHSHRTPSMHVE